MCEAASPPLIVLDTNVVLDWLIFEDRHCGSVAASIVSGAVRWVATRAMRDEVRHVLARGGFRHLARTAAGPDLGRFWARWEAHCLELAAPTQTARALRCRDPDDQKFIDLSVACRAHWLLSRDQAVLRLGRRLQDVAGVMVSRPVDWSGPAAGPREP